MFLAHSRYFQALAPFPTPRGAAAQCARPAGSRGSAQISPELDQQSFLWAISCPYPASAAQVLVPEPLSLGVCILCCRPCSLARALAAAQEVREAGLCGHPPVSAPGDQTSAGSREKGHQDGGWLIGSPAWSVPTGCPNPAKHGRQKGLFSKPKDRTLGV